MGTRTKMICTIGPSVNTLEKIIELMKAGMSVARLNFSHGTHAEHQSMIEALKEARRQLKIPLAIMLDTKGPEIRIGYIKGGQVELSPGQEWLLINETIEGNNEEVSIVPPNVLDELKVGTRILFDNGYISSQVIKKTDRGVVVKIDNKGVIKSQKGVNVPNVSLNLPAMTERDIEDIRFGCKQNIDVIAASFIRSPEHVLIIRNLLDQENKSDILVIAKIENSEGVQNFDSIVQVADGIMIARGDLGVEVPLSQVPKLQKMMIRKSVMAGKPAITATQMLESMINNPRPTRAEASDVANAIYDSTSAVMLSGETAIGKFPLETVNMMQSIIKEAEADFNYRNFFDMHSPMTYHDVPSALTLAAVKIAYSSGAQAVFAFTSGGSTARLLSRLRPPVPIVAMTSNEKCYNQMALFWGVTPFLGTFCKTIGEAFAQISGYALEKEIVHYGDLVIVTAGSPFGISGTTNMMIVESIGDVLVRGHIGFGQRMHGNVSIILSPELKKPYAVRDQLLVLTKCDESYLPLIEEAAGIILENQIDDLNSERYATTIATTLHKSVILRADAASRCLKEGQLVTLDPDKALVYKGVVF